MARRAYWGDLRLQREVRKIIPTPQRGSLQIHQGLERDRALVIASSPNFTINIQVQCFWSPEADFSKDKFRAREMAFISAAISRAKKTHPLFYVSDDTTANTVSTYVGSTVTTSTAHGHSNGDVVLIRRLGADLYTYGTISSASGSTFTLSNSHAIANGDEVFLVEAYWPGCAITQMPGADGGNEGDYYAESAVYGFTCSGEAAYTAQTIDLD